MRRLPIFLVVDVSESMAGNSHRQMQEAINRLVQRLRADPYALESVYISVIAFNEKQYMGAGGDDGFDFEINRSRG